MAEEQKKSIIHTMAGITSLMERMEEMCGRTHLSTNSPIQTVLDSNALLASVAKPRNSVMDSLLQSGALSAILAAPSKWTQNPLEGIKPAMPAMTKNLLLSTNLTALAALEAQTSTLACSKGITQLTSVASQITSITEMLASQSAFVREMIAPSSMLSDFQKMAEQTHKTILSEGTLTAWQLGLLDSASFMVDRQVDWASRFCSATYNIESYPQFEEFGDYSPKVNVIQRLPEELEYEHSKNEDITPSEALEKTPSFQMSERGKELVEKIVNINKTCQRKKLNPIFTYTNATMMAATNLGGTVCTNNGSFGTIIDGLYFFFYENLKHIKQMFSDEAVRNEDIFQCIFRVKDMRTDLRHDYEHGDNIEKKMNDIAESYSYYTGKVTPTSSNDYIVAQEGLYKDFYKLADHIQEVVEKHE